MFADDTSIQCSSPSVAEVEHSVQNDLNAVHEWIDANKLKLKCWLAPGKDCMLRGVKIDSHLS